jgi:hypothetical protein
MAHPCKAIIAIEWLNSVLTVAACMQEDWAGPSLVKRTALHCRCAACFYLVSRIRLISVYCMHMLWLTMMNCLARVHSVTASAVALGAHNVSPTQQMVLSCRYCRSKAVCRVQTLTIQAG